jgi:hypothetical protein
MNDELGSVGRKVSREAAWKARTTDRFGVDDGSRKIAARKLFTSFPLGKKLGPRGDKISWRPFLVVSKYRH